MKKIYLTDNKFLVNLISDYCGYSVINNEEAKTLFSKHVSLLTSMRKAVDKLDLEQGSVIYTKKYSGSDLTQDEKDLLKEIRTNLLLNEGKDFVLIEMWSE